MLLMFKQCSKVDVSCRDALPGGLTAAAGAHKDVNFGVDALAAPHIELLHNRGIYQAAAASTQ
jgi:hypothetical protein